MSIFFEPLVKASYFHKKILFVGNTIEAKSRDIKIFFFQIRLFKGSEEAGLEQCGRFDAKWWIFRIHFTPAKFASEKQNQLYRE